MDGAGELEDLYDEFGNYIGPDDAAAAGDESSEDEAPAASASAEREVDRAALSELEVEEEARAPGATAIVLHEDKKYYPDADEVFGDAQVMVEEEDTQAIEEPLLQPAGGKTFAVEEKAPLESRHSEAFVQVLASKPQLIRNVAVAGHLHHGKTTLCDVLVAQTLANRAALSHGERFCDTRNDEQARGISIKACPVTLPLEDGRGKTYLVNVLDLPGHVNFSDEVTMGLQLCDGMLLCVDAVEGAVLGTERALEQAAASGVRVTLCITKMDRLIHELKLPPGDAYYKLRSIIEAVNDLLARCGAPQEPLCPAAGTVCFAAGLDGWCFSLESFARLHIAKRGMAGVAPAELAKRLWGDRYFDPSTGRFGKKPAATAGSRARSFVQFVLEPLYKVYAQTLGEDPAVLATSLASVGVQLSAREMRMGVKPLLRLVLRRFFASEASSGVVDMLARHVPAPGIPVAPDDRAWDQLCPGGQSALLSEHPLVRRLAHLDGPRVRELVACSADAPLLVNVTKLLAAADGESFAALGRVMSGTLRAGQAVRISEGAGEDSAAHGTVGGLALCQGRHTLPVQEAPAGNWVLIEGVDALIEKAATLSAEGEEGVAPVAFTRPRFSDVASVKLAIEPLTPSELPKMLHGLRCVSKSYPLLRVKVEESGEHVVCGTGELYLDCVMHDLREMYANVEIKVSDPMVSFCETVVETSALKTYSRTANGKSELTMIAEPLEPALASEAESGALRLDWPTQDLEARLQERFGWDKLASRSLWAFGPEAQGPNALLNDALGPEARKGLEQVRESVVQGFRWATREGPLCDEPLRNVKFRVLDATVASEAVYRGAGFIIPTARRVAYSSFLTATPRLMEPISRVEIQAPADLGQAVQRVLWRRRGHITGDRPVPGTPFAIFHGYLPVVDAFGFETDLRAHTQGRAFPLQVFDHWKVVPGDPLDRSVQLRPLEPSRERDLAREFLVKTRRRKGLAEDVAMDKHFDDPDLLREFEARRDGRMEDDAEEDSDSD